MPIKQCGDEAPQDHDQRVISGWIIPTSPEEHALDVDGDPQQRAENTLAPLLAALGGRANQSYEQTLNNAIRDGTTLTLLDLAPGATAHVYFGEDCDDPPDSANNLSGSAALQVRSDSPSDSRLDGASIESLTGNKLTLELVVPGDLVFSLSLVGPQLVALDSPPTLTTATLAGGLPESDLHSTVLPAFAEGYQTIIAAQCTGAPPQCCLANTDGEGYLAAFDADGDCVITAQEIANADILAALLLPDVDLLNGDAYDPRSDGVAESFSFGVGLSTVGARFALAEGN